jgi:hypothetical protein
MPLDRQRQHARAGDETTTPNRTYPYRDRNSAYYRAPIRLSSLPERVADRVPRQGSYRDNVSASENRRPVNECVRSRLATPFDLRGYVYYGRWAPSLESRDHRHGRSSLGSGRARATVRSRTTEEARRRKVRYMTGPPFSSHQPWQYSHRADPLARAIADRHYNRQKIGSPQFVPPGRCIVLVATGSLPEHGSFWVTSWPYAEYVRHAWPGAWVCSAF